MEKSGFEMPMMSSLLSLPLLQGLTLEQLMSLLEKVRPDFMHVTDERFLRCGEPHDRVIFILKGTVSRSVADSSRRCTLVETLDEQSIIELDTLFGRYATYTADYSAVGDVTLLAFDKHFMFSAFNHFEVVQLNMLNLYSARLQSLQQRLADGNGCDVTSLFCRLLDSLCVNTRGSKQLTVTRVELADLLGCSRRRMSDQIAAWEEQGLLSTAYSTITINDYSHFMAAVRATRS